MNVLKEEKQSIHKEKLSKTQYAKNITVYALCVGMSACLHCSLHILLYSGSGIRTMEHFLHQWRSVFLCPAPSTVDPMRPRKFSENMMVQVFLKLLKLPWARVVLVSSSIL